MSMIDLNFVRQCRKDSKDIASILDNPNDTRNHYNEFVFGAVKQMYMKKLGKMDATAALSFYEMATFIDQRVVRQAVEESYLRKNFKNFEGERIFKETTGIGPANTVYLKRQIQASGFSSTSTNTSSRIKDAAVPTEMKLIRAGVAAIRRDIKQFEEGFELTLDDLEYAADKNLPLQDFLMARVARDLMMNEQYFAFNYNPASTYIAPEEYGLLNNTAISTSVSWTAGALAASGTTGRAIVDEFNRIESVIAQATGGIYWDNPSVPFCCVTSLANVQYLQKTYSDLDGKSPMQYLTDRGVRIGGMPTLKGATTPYDNVAFFYYNSPDTVELSTSVMIEARQQGYDAKTRSWTFPFRNVTAGLTVSQPEFIYKVSGLNP